MNSRRIGIVGGGAAGLFAAIACAEAGGGDEISVLEKSPQFLSKVRISGGGRCNVTHACFDAHAFSSAYPRGERELIGPFNRFQAEDTVAWFAAHGVKLKAESDGRMFPTTDSSQTIVDCLLTTARDCGVELVANCGVERVAASPSGGFELELSQPGPGQTFAGRFAAEGGSHKLVCDKLLLALGGCRAPALGQLAVSLGHTLEPPVPSLFTFHLEASWLRALSGISVEPVVVSVPNTNLRESGALLVTHSGLSGPVILRLSAWGARALHALNYEFPICINWLPRLSDATLASEFQSRRLSQPARRMVNSPIAPIPARLWEQLVIHAGVPRDMRWSDLSRSLQHRLAQQLLGMQLEVRGKSLNKDEFVTCGGVRLREVNFKTMESRLCPGLYFAGEMLDIDGITGGFNFQAAWTTGWIAGRAMAGVASYQS